MATVREAPRERPILFSAPMVRAILDGRKTQTRRIVKPQPAAHPALRPEARSAGRWVFMAYSHSPSLAFATGDVRAYAAPGDRLWVRETFKPNGDGGWMYCDDFTAYEWERSRGKRPSIHMPRAVSRIDLKVTGVRVERLQAITEDDARAEGFEANPYAMGDGTIDEAMSIPARVNFASLWDAINGKRAAWATNPWVWVVEFRRVRP